MNHHLLTTLDAQLRFHDLPGPGVPLVFLHGLGCASSCDFPRIAWDPALPRCRCLLVDLLGSGFSDRPSGFSYSIEDHAQTLAELLEALKVPPVDLFGHSMGGTLAIQLAGLRPDRIRRLVVAEPNLDPGGGVFSRAIAAYSEAEYVAQGHQALIRGARADGNALWAASMARSAPHAIHREAQSLVQGGDPSWRSQLLALPHARTVLFGQRSLPDPDSSRLMEAGLRVSVVPDAGHSMMWENPPGLARTLAEALA